MCYVFFRRCSTISSSVPLLPAQVRVWRAQRRVRACVAPDVQQRRTSLVHRAKSQSSLMLKSVSTIIMHVHLHHLPGVLLPRRPISGHGSHVGVGAVSWRVAERRPATTATHQFATERHEALWVACFEWYLVQFWLWLNSETYLQWVKRLRKPTKSANTKIFMNINKTTKQTNRKEMRCVTDWHEICSNFLTLICECRTCTGTCCSLWTPSRASWVCRTSPCRRIWLKALIRMNGWVNTLSYFLHGPSFKWSCFSGGLNGVRKFLGLCKINILT